MNRSIVLTLSAAVILGACSDHKSTTVAAAPEPVAAQPSKPATEAPPVALPPLPAVTEKDTAATAASEAPTPVGSAPAAVDSPATNPKGTLTKAEESNSMPQAAHGNNHSSPSLDSRPTSDSAPQK